jgi:hypothetical protein
MQTYLVYILSIGVYFLSSYFLLGGGGGGGGGKDSSLLTQVVLYWMVFGIFIGLFEVVLFLKKRYIAALPRRAKNFWLRDISLPGIFQANFWSKGWKEYGDFCDSRYLTTQHLVHFIELIHALTAFAYGYILYYYMRFRTLDNPMLGKMMIVIASCHLFFTLVYLCSLYFHLSNNPIKKGPKFWFYLLTNSLWVIMPVLVLVKGLEILRK